MKCYYRDIPCSVFMALNRYAEIAYGTKNHETKLLIERGFANLILGNKEEVELALSNGIRIEH